MDYTVRAVYVDGVLRPLEPLPLSNGQSVEITVRLGQQELAQHWQAWRDFLDNLEPLSEEQLRLLEDSAQRRPLFRPFAWDK
ncbi:MAG: antitoxin family protein [Fimbriimonadales bacterium]|jgi:predicted DNA-binding antitoxin AbrB/MazE fold protein